MAPLAPEAGHGLPDRQVFATRVAVDVPRVRELGERGRVDEVDLGVGEGLQGREAELFG